VTVNQIICGNTLSELKKLPDDYVDTIITSPPYWGLRDYGVEGQIGLEPTLDLYISHLLQITQQLKRVLKKTGVMYWNHGDCYGGSWQNYGARENKQRTKNTRSFNRPGNPTVLPPTVFMTPKCLVLQNYRLILKMIDDQGWILRNDIVWWKPNATPSSVKDRFSNSHEPVFMLAKKKKYWFDLDAVRQPHAESSIDHRQAGKLQGSSGKNPGDVWKIATQPFPEAHFATFPEKLVIPMVKSSCPAEICRKCGKARARITKPTEEYAKHLGSWQFPKSDKMVHNKQGKPSLIADYKTIGWTDCGCNAGWRPGVVLDPFSGAGTTCLVAKKLQRDYIGIDIKKEYCEMSERRIEKECGGLF
jgi:DNA modification methylase